MGRKRAFTLIELLVVIAIIGVLTAILMPSLRKVKVQARRTKCVTNLHQIGVGMQGLLNDNNDRYPRISWVPSRGPFPLPADSDPVYLADVLTPYVNSSESVFHCPDDQPGRVDREPPMSQMSFFESERSSYEYRVRIAGRSIDEVAGRRKERTGQPTPTNTIWVMRDYHNFHRIERRISDEDEANYDDETAPEMRVRQRNYLFADGHVGDYENF